MIAVAEGLIGTLAAGAKGHPVADFIKSAVGRFNRNTTPHPDWAHLAFLSVIDQPDGWFKNRLDNFTLLIPDDEPS